MINAMPSGHATETPRTDALADVPTPLMADFASFRIRLYADHARQLERENATARALLREAYQYLNAQYIVPEDYEAWERRYEAFR